ncbi:endopolygalacturonase [Xanthomonas translucens pv. arrhenatheri]|uniref:Polygalacturonase n=1 Tax=Xanthomonas graminis pv. arrhenatheri LMG 727 TaxID=1195923 RepID=A0A0K2ZIQ7_9XANT|nr:glycosyl hydrolase family 28 protein [Xanthomonas translucens]OAX64947.1 endopolygalacturonase [Xanthomonas translucens pv. arrhenatheri]UKE78331.1 endopolygalacturonase [Xanthomonas translucens pv. arrhenatheri]CTP85661.1 polygalacturonase precursor [Xanthomonas translucens pv. arrhenatheri LMG 727]
MTSPAFGCLLLLALVTLDASAATGDTRVVAEPAMPSLCDTLDATLQADARTFSDADERNAPDTARIQAALGSCAAKGGRSAVLLRAGAGDAFLSGPLNIGGNVTLVIDAGVTLFASRKPSDYQVAGANACGKAAGSSGGCRALLNLKGKSLGVMGLRDGAGRQGSIDGRGDLPMLGGSDSWWQFGEKAKASGLTQNSPDLIKVQNASDVSIYHVNLVNAPYFHLFAHIADGLTVWGVRVKAPASSPNTDGLDLDSVSNATLYDNDVMSGDDGVAIKTIASRSANISVRDSRFYGNSVLGSDADGRPSTDNNGLRIKTGLAKGGPVSDVTYRNTCLFGVANALVINPLYGGGSSGIVPSFANIVVNGLKAQGSVKGKGSSVRGYDASAPLDLVLANVSVDFTALKASNARIGLDRSNLQPSADSTVSTYATSVSGAVPACDSKPVFPAL